MINIAMRQKKEATKRNASKIEYYEEKIEEYRSDKIDNFTFIKSTYQLP